jgi:hypothetical protein
MKTLLAISLIAIFESPLAFADCVVPPSAPNVPSGETASRDDMLAAMKRVKAYNVEVALYSDCVINTGGDDNQRNAVINALQHIADKFNAELRIFKAKNGA